ncbi:MAG: hypothetical protein ACSLFH_16005 [Desulfuromonadales bacterium]
MRRPFARWSGPGPKRPPDGDAQHPGSLPGGAASQARADPQQSPLDLEWTGGYPDLLRADDAWRALPSRSILTIYYDPGAKLAFAGSIAMGCGVLLTLVSFYRKRARGDRPDIA